MQHHNDAESRFIHDGRPDGITVVFGIHGLSFNPTALRKAKIVWTLLP